VISAEHAILHARMKSMGPRRSLSSLNDLTIPVLSSSQPVAKPTHGPLKNSEIHMSHVAPEFISFEVLNYNEYKGSLISTYDFSHTSIGINFTNGLIHDVMNAVVDGMNDERNHAQADERSDPFTCCQWNLGNYLLHGP